MLDFTNEKKDCTGCTACTNVCPVGCITMKQDEEGFDFPISDERCIHCGKCEKVCPIASGYTRVQPSIKQYAAAAVTKDTDVWKASSSGGAFTEICNIYGDNNTIVFGAAFDGLKVVHKYVIGVKNIGIFRRSKYVQSSVGECFSRAEQFLKQGKKVIFSGTPCQIAGLRSYLKREYDNLLCIDLICHGAGSPKVFEGILKHDGEKQGSEIIAYSFREKRIIMGNVYLHVSYRAFANNKKEYVEKDDYNRLFLKQLCLRKSCGNNCRFRTSKRMGDITIADFKNKLKVFPDMKDYKNYSTVIVNTNKGHEVYKNLSERMNIFQCDLEDIKENNPLFYKTTEANPLRDSFFKDFIEGIEVDDIIRRYAPTQRKKIFDALSRLIPYSLRLWRMRLSNKKRRKI